VIEPENTVQSVVTDLNSKVPMFPLHAFLDVSSTVATYKGKAESLLYNIPPSSSYVFPHTAHAVTADETEPPRQILGAIIAPGEVGFVPASQVSVVDRTDMYTVFPDAPAPDATPPTVTLISPLSLVDIANDQTITLEFDDDRGIEFFIIYARDPDLGLTEVIVDGTELDEETSYTRTPSTVDGKQRWEFARTGGWPQKQGVAVSGVIRAIPIDGAGNVG
jgi:hypothetical protein